MRTVFVNILATCSSLVTLLAGQLDVAVIQFPEQKSLAELQSAFATVNLFEMTRCRSHTHLQRLSQRWQRSLRATLAGRSRLELLHIDTPARIRAPTWPVA